MTKLDLDLLVQQYAACADSIPSELRAWVGAKLIERDAQQERALHATRTHSAVFRKDIAVVIQCSLRSAARLGSLRGALLGPV